MIIVLQNELRLSDIFIHVTNCLLLVIAYKVLRLLSILYSGAMKIRYNRFRLNINNYFPDKETDIRFVSLFKYYILFNFLNIDII